MNSPRECANAPWRVGVVVPARNEERSIVYCVEAILAALDTCPKIDASWIVVAADDCEDRTAALARHRLGDRGTVIECDAASPGAARRLGTAEVLRHFQALPLASLWIANTDADSHVSTDWIARQLHWADLGYCGVAGIVNVESLEHHDTVALREILADYTIHSDGTHPHVHGANLGIRADAYLDAGCWSNLKLAEDHCLWSRVRARGWQVTSCCKSIVHTSGRLHGRATGGFADSLRQRLECLHGGVATCTR